MKKTLLLTMSATLLSVSPVFSEQKTITGCVIDGKDIILRGKAIGRYNGKYVVKLPEFRGVGKREGRYIVRLSDKKEACRQDGEYVVNTRTGKSLGKGDAAAICLCAGLLD